MTAWWVAVIGALWACVVGLTIVVAGLLRRMTVVLEAQPLVHQSTAQRRGPAPGTRLVTSNVVDAGGNAVSLSEIPGPVVVAVLTTTCEPCLTVRDWLLLHPDRVSRATGRLIVLTNAGARATLGLDHVVTVLVDEQGGAISALHLPGTPYVIAVGREGTVTQSSVLSGPERLDAMLRDDRLARDELAFAEPSRWSG